MRICSKNDRMDAIVVGTFVVVGGTCQTTHPSYQAWSYASLIEDFYQDGREIPFKLEPFAYLQKYLIQENDPLTNQHYTEHIKKHPYSLRGK